MPVEVFELNKIKRADFKLANVQCHALWQTKIYECNARWEKQLCKKNYSQTVETNFCRQNIRKSGERKICVAGSGRGASHFAE